MPHTRHGRCLRHPQGTPPGQPGRPAPGSSPSATANPKKVVPPEAMAGPTDARDAAAERLRAGLGRVRALEPGAGGRAAAAAPDTEPPFADLAAALEREAAKAGLALAAEGSAAGVKAEALLDGLAAAHGVLCDWLVRLGPAAGPTLAAEFTAAAAGVTEALLRVLAAAGTPALTPAVGVAFDRCRAVARLTSENRVAVGRSLTRSAASVKDVVRELAEMLEGADADEFAEGDARLVAAFRPGLGAALKAMKAGVRALFAAPEPADAAGVARLEQVAAAGKRAALAADEIGAALYPEQEQAELEAGVRDLHAALGEVAATLGADAGGGDAGEGEGDGGAEMLAAVAERFGGGKGAEARCEPFTE